MYIEAIPCPRCAVLRTLRLGDGRSLCCNCRLQWDPAAPRSPLHAPDSDDSLPYAFTPLELARLATYRVAVQAGFFSDWGVVADDTPKDLQVNVKLLDDAVRVPSAFTPRELTRLAAYKGAVAAELYSDQLPTH
jgi:hypothetical protein